MNRRIIDYEKLTTEVLDLLVEKFPDGYGYDDIMSFQNAKGETIRAVEVRTEDTVYLVKIGQKLEQRMDDHADVDEEEEDDFESDEDLPFDEDSFIEEQRVKKLTICTLRVITVKLKQNYPALKFELF